MTVENNLSLLDAAKLISRSFTDRERQFAGELAIYLQRRINERRNVVIMRNSSSAVTDEIKSGIKVSKNLVNASLATAGGAVVGSIAFVTPIGPIVGGIAVTAGATIAAYAIARALKAVPKKRIEQNAKIYNNFFPKEHSDMIKLFSQLASLSVVEKLKTVLIVQEIPTVLQSMKKTKDKAIDKISRVRRLSRQDEKGAIEALVNKEFAEIWSIFKEFTREREAYSSFKGTPASKKIIDLFATHCDLGDPADKSDVVSDFEVHALWINIFSRYLEGKDEAVRESVLSTLRSELSVIAENPSSTSLSSQGSSSSGVSMSDSLYSPQFFAPKIAALAANNPEPEQNLGPGTRL